MSVRKWRAVVTFYAETPENEIEADQRADELTLGIEVQLAGIDGVAEGSISVPELDAVLEGE